MTFYIVAILVLIIFSGFFSGSETGITAASRSKLHKLKLEGNSRAEKASYIREHKEDFIGTVLLGNNLVNIMASALATSVFIELFGPEGVIYATIAMTFLVLIFAELLPKTYAFTHAEKVALAVSPLFMILIKISSPITKIIQYVVNAIIALFMRGRLHDELVSGQEVLRGAIELQHEEGRVQKDDRDMLGSILDLSRVTVGDIMVHRKKMMMINADQPIKHIVQQVLDEQFTRIPLWRDDPDNIVGVLHVRSLLKSLQSHHGSLDTLDLDSIAVDPWFIPESTPVSKQLQEFRKQRQHFALVVDEYGDLQGLVTLEDVLEEIVGDIIDEHDQEMEGIKEDKNGWYYVEGSVTIRDFNRQLGWNLPDTDASTIAGLIIHEAESIPDIGEIFSFHQVTFEIHDKEQNQITRVRVKKEEE